MIHFLSHLEILEIYMILFFLLQAEEQLKKAKETKKPDVLKEEEEEWQTVSLFLNLFLNTQIKLEEGAVKWPDVRYTQTTILVFTIMIGINKNVSKYPNLY